MDWGQGAGEKEVPVLWIVASGAIFLLKAVLPSVAFSPGVCGGRE